MIEKCNWIECVAVIDSVYAMHAYRALLLCHCWSKNKTTEAENSQKKEGTHTPFVCTREYVVNMFAANTICLCVPFLVDTFVGSTIVSFHLGKSRFFLFSQLIRWIFFWRKKKIKFKRNTFVKVDLLCHWKKKKAKAKWMRCLYE